MTETKKPYPVGSPEAKAIVAKIRKQEMMRSKGGWRKAPDGNWYKPGLGYEKGHRDYVEERKNGTARPV